MQTCTGSALEAKGWPFPPVANFAKPQANEAQDGSTVQAPVSAPAHMPLQTCGSPCLRWDCLQEVAVHRMGLHRQVPFACGGPVLLPTERNLG